MIAMLFVRNFKKFMEKYKILDHPADIKIQAFGKTKEELFLNAMLGMNEVLDPKIIDKKVENKIEIGDAPDIESLLVDFLSGILYLTQINREIYDKIKFNKFNDKELQGNLFGNKIESFEQDIKGVTYHDLKVDQKNGLYQVFITFDV